MCNVRVVKEKDLLKKLAIILNRGVSAEDVEDIAHSDEFTALGQLTCCFTLRGLTDQVQQAEFVYAGSRGFGGPTGLCVTNGSAVNTIVSGTIKDFNSMLFGNTPVMRAIYNINPRFCYSKRFIEELNKGTEWFPMVIAKDASNFVDGNDSFVCYHRYLTFEVSCNLQTLAKISQFSGINLHYDLNRNKGFLTLNLFTLQSLHNFAKKCIGTELTEVVREMYSLALNDTVNAKFLKKVV